MRSLFESYRVQEQGFGSFTEQEKDFFVDQVNKSGAKKVFKRLGTLVRCMEFFDSLVYNAAFVHDQTFVNSQVQWMTIVEFFKSWEKKGFVLSYINSSSERKA